MKISVNKTQRKVTEGINLFNLLQKINMVPEKTLASVNDEIIPRDEFANTTLKENDEIDLFSFVGGG